MHKALVVRIWTDANVGVFDDVPPYSPDLNPIENIWGLMKRYLRRNPARNLKDIWEKLPVYWRSIPSEFCRFCAYLVHGKSSNFLLRLFHPLPYRLIYQAFKTVQVMKNLCSRITLTYCTHYE